METSRSGLGREKFDNGHPNFARASVWMSGSVTFSDEISGSGHCPYRTDELLHVILPETQFCLARSVETRSRSNCSLVGLLLGWFSRSVGCSVARSIAAPLASLVSPLRVRFSSRRVNPSRSQQILHSATVSSLNKRFHTQSSDEKKKSSLCEYRS